MELACGLFGPISTLIPSNIGIHTLGTKKGSDEIWGVSCDKGENWQSDTLYDWDMSNGCNGLDVTIGGWDFADLQSACGDRCLVLKFQALVENSTDDSDGFAEMISILNLDDGINSPEYLTRLNLDGGTKAASISMNSSGS